MVSRAKSKESPFQAACRVDFAAMTVGAEVGSDINVAVILEDADHKALQEAGSVFGYLSTDPGGQNVAVTAPSGGAIIGTHGVAIPLVAGKAWQFISSAAGLFDLTITGTTATFYLVLVMPSGNLVISPIISLA